MLNVVCDIFLTNLRCIIVYYLSNLLVQIWKMNVSTLLLLGPNTYVTLSKTETMLLTYPRHLVEIKVGSSKHIVYNCHTG